MSDLFSIFHGEQVNFFLINYVRNNKKSAI
mgnify:CR=1 FL=1